MMTLSEPPKKLWECMMIEFTKEELKWISDTICYYQNDGCLNIDEIPILDSVSLKIQSMIDNYCEHNMKYASGEYMQCDKCGVRE